MTRVLITGVGGPTPIGIARSLKLVYKDIELVGVDADRYAPGLYRQELFDKTYQVPRASDSAYWDYLQKIVDQEHIDYAFVVPEREVLAWAKRKASHQLPCESLIPPQNIAEFLYDKFLVSEALAPLKLVPATIPLAGTTEEQVETSSIGERLGYPYWIRAARGAGALGAFKIQSEADLLNWLAMNPAASDLIASTYLPGGNYACKVLFYEGEVVMTAAGERVAYLLAAAAPSGVSGMCARGRLLNNSDLVDRSLKALGHIHKLLDQPLHGMFTVDFKGARDGTPLITEINIRHVSFTHAFSMAGANFAVKTLQIFYQKKAFSADHYQFSNDLHFFRGVDHEIQLHSESELKSLDY